MSRRCAGRKVRPSFHVVRSISCPCSQTKPFPPQVPHPLMPFETTVDAHRSHCAITISAQRSQMGRETKSPPSAGRESARTPASAVGGSATASRLSVRASATAVTKIWTVERYFAGTSSRARAT